VDDSAQASVLSAPAAVTVAGSDNTDSRNSNSVNTRVSCFISSAYQDEGFHALSLLVLAGVFWLLGQGHPDDTDSEGHHIRFLKACG
jgi:hypothetical protein